MLVTDEPPLVTGSHSSLSAPRRCRIYTLNGRDNRSAGPPYESPVLFGCGVDSQGIVYGLVTGGYGDLAVVAGEREVGVFLAFDHTMVGREPTPATITGSDGLVPQIRAWAAPVNVHDPFDPVPEFPGDGTAAFADDRQVPIQVVAVGQTGALLSLGWFDYTRLQVSLLLLWDRIDPIPIPSDIEWRGYIERFYVNGEPDIDKRGACVGCIKR
jgi:hypothetical protein